MKVSLNFDMVKKLAGSFASTINIPWDVAKSRNFFISFLRISF